MVELIFVIVAMLLLCTPINMYFAKEAVNDRKWYKYEESYQKWRNNGRKGEMPVPEDFGWKPPNEN